MSLPRFFVAAADLAAADRTRAYFLRGPNFHHAKNVLRLKTGERLILCGGDGEDSEFEITAIQAAALELQLLEKRPNPAEAGARLYLWQALPKGGKMDEIVEKAVELGAFAICPLVSRRSLLRRDEARKDRKQERWQKIAEAAAKQSGRGIIPELRPTVDFAAACAELAQVQAGGRALVFMAWEAERAVTLNALPSLQGRGCAENSVVPVWQEVHFLIGPEGGFAAEEALLAEKSGIVSVSLGSRILRTETAGPSVLAMLNALLPGRMA